MILKLLKRVGLGLALLAAAPLWAQGDSSVPVPAVSGRADSGDQMMVPAPVSGEAYEVAYGAETRSNFLRGGLSFDAAYSDNVFTGLDGKPVSDVSYSVSPSIAFDVTRPRLHWGLSYAPGFTFYQRTDGRNEADHNVVVSLRYRLSPHVTVHFSDAFQKSSSAFNGPDQLPGSVVSGSAQGSDFAVVAPLADRLTNNGTAGINYQFSAHGMVGASGTFTNLHYPNPGEVAGSDPTLLTGLYDASSRSGSAFYSQRLTRKHYVGLTYQYQKLLSYPTGIPHAIDTETHAILFFYTLYATPAFSMSFFGGPQRSTTDLPGEPTSQSWYPAAGASLNWQARHTAAAVSYSRMITGGGGLIGAAQADSASASLRQQISKNLSASLSGFYSNRNILTTSSLPNTSGHSVSGSVSLQRQLGEHLSLRAGYTRLRQVYQNVDVFSPDTNREWASITYEFVRPLGR